jgi:hypothetical protein
LWYISGGLANRNIANREEMGIPVCRLNKMGGDRAGKWPPSLLIVLKERGSQLKVRMEKERLKVTGLRRQKEMSRRRKVSGV